MQKLTRTYYKFILFLFIIFFTISCVTIKNVSGATEKIMEIITEEEIYEEKNFSISVLDPDLINIEEIETPYLSDVQRHDIVY